jgi:hypothetical protein
MENSIRGKKRNGRRFFLDRNIKDLIYKTSACEIMNKLCGGRSGPRRYLNEGLKNEVCRDRV